MRVKLKGLYSTSKDISAYDRGRSYFIGSIMASVQLTEDGLILLVTNRDLAKKLTELLKQVDEGGNHEKKDIH